MKHIVTVTYSDPSHEFMSLKGRTKTTNYMVEARSADEAQLRASSHFRSMGYKIHSAIILEQKTEKPVAPAVLSEEVEQIDEVNARHSFVAAQAALTPKASDVKAASGKNARDKAATNKYARRISKLTGGEYSKQDVKDNLKSLAKEEVEQIDEKLTAADPASKWISDFVKSDNPRFAGKSKKERIQQALGAYYAAKRGTNEEVEQIDEGAVRDAKVANHNAAVDKMTKKGFAKLDYRHPDLLKTAPKGYTFSISHRLVPWTKEEVEQIDEGASIDYKALEKPTVARIKSGETKLPPRTNYDVPPGMRKAKKEGQVAEGSEDPSNILSIIKAAAKAKTLAKQMHPNIRLGLTKNNPVNAQGPHDEDIKEDVEDPKKADGETKNLAKNKEVKHTEKETEVAKAKDKVLKGKKNPVILHPQKYNVPAVVMPFNPGSGMSGS